MQWETDRLQSLELSGDQHLQPHMSDDPETNPYELLDLSTDATDQDIRTAYRKLSLKVHPDRVRVARSLNPRSR